MEDEQLYDGDGEDEMRDVESAVVPSLHHCEGGACQKPEYRQRDETKDDHCVSELLQEFAGLDIVVHIENSMHAEESNEYTTEHLVQYFQLFMAALEE